MLVGFLPDGRTTRCPVRVRSVCTVANVVLSRLWINGLGRKQRVGSAGGEIAADVLMSREGGKCRCAACWHAHLHLERNRGYRGAYLRLDNDVGGQC